MKIFNNYAAYYDLLNSEKDYNGEVNYVDNFLKKYNININSEILELGCGTGKHAKLFAKKGYSIHGIDMSEKMIQIAKLNLNEDFKNKLIFEVGDVRNLSLNKEFNVIISLFHVVSYQISNNDVSKMFELVSNHIKIGGLFIFDCWYGPGVLNNLPEVRIKNLKNDEINVLRISKPTIFPNDNCVKVNFTIQINKNNEILENFEEEHKMRYFFKPELDFLLGLYGFEIVEQVEWMTNKNIGFQSWLSMFIAKKIK